MAKTLFYFVSGLIVVAVLSMSSCKKPLSFSKGNLSFSADTVVFDTVFTTIGSTTQRFKLYNNDNRPIVLEQIELVGGANSPFRINFDGLTGTNFADIEMEANDSLYVFVEVTIDPNNGTNPMIIEDRIRFRTNGVDQYVELVAWGQDAYFHYSYISAGIFDLNEGTWANDKPHVIYGAAIVDSSKTLTIPAGTDIYLHKNARLWIYKGELNIEGTYGNEVTFQGDRLESYYDDVSGQYHGIYFHQAMSSTINHAIIKNGIAGIHLYSEDNANTDYTLTVTNTEIYNNASYGLFLYSGARVKAENCVIAKNGVHGLIVLKGGDFNFNNCHLLGYGNGDNTGSAVGISNYFVDQLNNVTNIGSINEGTIINSIIYGNLEQEIVLDTISDMAFALNFNMSDNHIRSEVIPTDPFFIDNTFNEEPLFYNIDQSNFRVWWSNASPIVNAANPVTATLTSIDDQPRDASPDKGAYEFQ